MFAIAPTDRQWFEFIRDEFDGRLANFWTPTPWRVRQLAPGDRLYFMLKAPIRRIGGFGVFQSYREFSPDDAWALYGRGNGVPSRRDLIAKVEGFVRRRAPTAMDTWEEIGCIELADVITFGEDEFLDPNVLGHTFPYEVVKLKYFREPDNLATAFARPAVPPAFELVLGETTRRATTTKHRPGRAAFRQSTLGNYGNRCCLTNEAVVDLLEASHIQPYVDIRSDHAQNAMCLRVDLHRLFDAGLITMADDGRVAIAGSLRGTSYEVFEGVIANWPAGPARPSPVALAEHRINVFRG